MKTAPLQLLNYWTDFIQVEANAKFDPEKHADLLHDSLKIGHSVDLIKKEENDSRHGSLWQTTLIIVQEIPEGKNIPYSFSIKMQGVVAAHPDFSSEELQRLVNANAPAMLFGAAREVLRAATARGPYPPVIIPSTNFINNSKHQKTEPKPKKISAKKAPSKSTARKKPAE